MKRWHFYDSSTGLFIGKSVGCTTASTLRVKPPAGCRAIEGEFDHPSQRVDVSTGEVVDYQPSEPSVDHEWIHDDPATGARVRRWVLKGEVADNYAADSKALHRMQDLELKAIRPLLELRENPSDASASAKLDEIQAERASLAVLLRKKSTGKETSEP